MHNINHKWSMAVFESILFHVFLIAFLVAAGSFFMASLPESSPIEVDLVDTTAGASGGAGSGSGHGSSVSKSDTVNVNQLPGGESKDSSAVSSDMASYEDNNEYSQNINTSTGGSGAADGSAQGSGSGNGTGSGSGDGTGTGYGSGTAPAPALVMALEMAMEKVLAEALQKGLKSYQGKNRFIHLRQGLPGFPALLLSDLS